MKVCLNPSNGSHTAVKRVISSRSPGTSEKPGAAVVGVKIPVATSFVENDVVPAAFLTRPPYIFDQRPARRSASVSVTGPEIGRAACGERVCQYVEVSGVAGR